MRTTELARIFAKRYHGAADKEGVLSIHLFGIEFAEELKAYGRIYMYRFNIYYTETLV